jgi:hypothetical protein
VLRWCGVVLGSGSAEPAAFRYGARMATLTLTDFLLARIAEEELEARVLDGTYDDHVADITSSTETQLALSPWFARWDPVRVFAECEAKRLIVELWRETAELAQGDFGQTQGGLTLALLALPYVDHPDYDPAWGVVAI